MRIANKNTAPGTHNNATRRKRARRRPPQAVDMTLSPRNPNGSTHAWNSSLPRALRPSIGIRREREVLEVGATVAVESPAAWARRQKPRGRGLARGDQKLAGRKPVLERAHCRRDN